MKPITKMTKQELAQYLRDQRERRKMKGSPTVKNRLTVKSLVKEWGVQEAALIDAIFKVLGDKDEN